METQAEFDDRDVTFELGWLRALALRLVHDATAADDLVQATVLAALHHRPRLGLGLKPWLTTVLRRQAALAVRGRRRRTEREERAARAEALPSADELAARAETQRALVDAVLSLTEPYRSVILLRYFEGYEPREIAERRGVPAATVRSQLARGLDELRATLDRRHRGSAAEWCTACVAFAFDRSWLRGAAGLSPAAFLALIAMTTWFKIAILSSLAGAVLLWMLSSVEETLDPSFVVAANERGEDDIAEPRAVGLTAPDSSLVERSPAADVETNRAQASSARPRLRGRVVDESTKAPLAGYQLVIRGPGAAREVLTSDDEGRFESVQEREPGLQTMLLRDIDPMVSAMRIADAVMSWSEGIEREVDWNGRDELELLVATGPIYRLAFTPPRGMTHADFEATLRAGDDRDPLLCGATLSTRTPVRGNPPFARFRNASLSIAAAHDERRILSIVSADGTWAARASVAATAGAHSEVVPLHLERASRLAITIESSTRAELDEPRVMFVNVDDGWSFSRSGSDLAGAPATTVFDGLPEGKYRVEVLSLGHVTARIELDLQAGETAVRSIVCEPLPVAGFVRGEFRSRSGSYRDRITLSLTSRPDKSVRHVAVEWLDRDGRLVAPFAFEGLEPGDFELAIFEWNHSNHRFEPMPGAVSAPSEGLVFNCEDLEPQERLTFRVLDAERTPIADANFDVRSGSRVLLSGSERCVFSIHPGAEVTWIVTARGFEPVRGDSMTLERSSDGLIQEVVLRRVP